MVDLHVELYGTHIGTLEGTWRAFDFIPSKDAVATFGLDSQVLSVAIPLAVVPTRAHKWRRQNFFRELLPEGRMLEHLASAARVGPHDTLGLLRRYGRDVAGALQIWDPETPGEPRHPSLEPLDDEGVASMLRDITANPIGNATAAGKSSLAGVQDKIVLVATDDGWARAVDGFASTHILKPAVHDRPTMIYDEEYGARFARALGLQSFPTRIERFDGEPALVIERYDRSPDAPNGRVHQEDFNQALAASGNEKYQRHGGRASLARIAEVLARLADRGSLERLLTMTVLSVAVGNLDMHAKNLSLLHPPDGSVVLAPAYDVGPQVHQPNDGELALSVDGVYRHADLTAEHLIREGASWGVADPSAVVTAALETVLTTATTQRPDPGAYQPLADEIAEFATNLLAGRAANAL